MYGRTIGCFSLFMRAVLSQRCSFLSLFCLISFKSGYFINNFCMTLIEILFLVKTIPILCKSDQQIVRYPYFCEKHSTNFDRFLSAARRFQSSQRGEYKRQDYAIAHSQSPSGHRRSNMQSGRHRLLTVHICQEEENDAPRALLVKTEKKEEPSLKKEDRRIKPQERRQESRTRNFTCTMFLCKLKQKENCHQSF